jgi:transglutaminase-like putative cysteine protease
MKPLLVLFPASVVFWLLGQTPGAAKDPAAAAHENVAARAGSLESDGHFKEAASVLTKALAAADLPAAARKALEFDLDRLERIKECYPYKQAEMFAELKKSVADLTEDEFALWVKEGRFDVRSIDGEERFVSSSVSNLFFRYPELDPRRRPLKDTTDLQRRYWESCRAIKTAAIEEKTPYVLPKHFRMTMTVTVEPGAAPKGETVRAWLPIPRSYPYQNGFKLISTVPSDNRVDDADSPIRSVYLERPAEAGLPLVFKVIYEYTRYGVWVDMKPEAVKPCDHESPDLRPYLSEGPHVVFTPEMRELSRQIVGDETNDYRKAKLIFDWVADHIKYSYAIEYSTIRNISDYTRSKCYGDCGQEALLFITLCRLNGIPARWQSGWNTFPRFKDMHDWTEMYLAPYGWVPVDPWQGIFAMRYASSLPAEKRREMRDFYFGGMDQYRMAANGDHSQELRPTKRTLRSDNVDFQRGEVECGGRNIYFGKYSYDLEIKEIEPARSKASK